jgi:hypothetical protein
MWSRASGDDDSFIGSGASQSNAPRVKTRPADENSADAAADAIQSDSREVQRTPRRHQFRFTLEDGSYADTEPDRAKRNLKLAATGLAVVLGGALLFARYLDRPALTSQPDAEPTATSNYVAPSEERSREQAVSVQAAATPTVATASASAQALSATKTPAAPAAPAKAAAPASPAKAPAAVAPAKPASAAPAKPAKGSDNPYADAPKAPAGSSTDNPY